MCTPSGQDNYHNRRQRTSMIFLFWRAWNFRTFGTIYASAVVQNWGFCVDCICWSIYLEDGTRNDPKEKANRDNEIAHCSAAFSCAFGFINFCHCRGKRTELQVFIQLANVANMSCPSATRGDPAILQAATFGILTVIKSKFCFLRDSGFGILY